MNGVTQQEGCIIATGEPFIGMRNALNHIQFFFGDQEYVTCIMVKVYLIQMRHKNYLQYTQFVQHACAKIVSYFYFDFFGSYRHRLASSPCLCLLYIQSSWSCCDVLYEYIHVRVCLHCKLTFNGFLIYTRMQYDCQSIHCQSYHPRPSHFDCTLFSYEKSVNKIGRKITFIHHINLRAA